MSVDNAIMRLISKGDERAFDRLFESYYVSLLSVATHMVGDNSAARDIVQEVFIRLWDNRRRYSDLKSPKDFLFIATRNHAISYLRSRQTLNAHRDRLLQEERFRAGLVEEEVFLLLAEAIDKLPPRTGEVIRLSLQGLPQEAIAGRMGIALATVKSLKADAVRKLRRMLGPFIFLLISCSLQSDRSFRDKWN